MALMKGEKDSGDETKDSKDAYCEEVCTEPYMQCMSLMEQGKLDGDGNDGGDKKEPVECDEDENFKVMMKGKDGKMMAKCCPAANTLWDWTDMQNPKAMQCCRTPITMDNKCEDGGQGGKPGRGRRRIVVRRRIINDILNWVTGGGDDKTSGEGDDDKMGGDRPGAEDKEGWGNWMDQLLGGGSGMMNEDVEKNKMGEKIDKERWTQKGDGEGGDKKEWWNKQPGGKDMGEGEGEGSGDMQKKMMLMQQMSEACANQMAACGKEMKDCGDDEVDCSEQEEMAFGDCLKRKSNETRGQNPKCAKLVSMVMKMMYEGDGKGEMGEGKENMCPRPCAEDFVENGGCALFGADSSDEDFGKTSEEKDEEWQ